MRLPDRAFTGRGLLLQESANVLVFAILLPSCRPSEVADDLVMHPGDLVIWFLFQGQPYDIGKDYSQQGEFRGYYIDALEPVLWHEDDSTTLEPLKDLFLDLWIWPDHRYQILDRDELLEARCQGQIAVESARLAESTIEHLVESHSSGTFPPSSVKEFHLSGSQVQVLVSELRMLS